MSFKGSKTEDQKDEALPARRPPITRQTPALRKQVGSKHHVMECIWPVNES